MFEEMEGLEEELKKNKKGEERGKEKEKRETVRPDINVSSPSKPSSSSPKPFNIEEEMSVEEYKQ